MGFTPRFPYLEGLDPRLNLARRSSPRNHVQPGTVAISGPHAGIYSVASPGGWHLLGQTELPLFRRSPFDELRVLSLSKGNRARHGSFSCAFPELLASNTNQALYLYSQ